MEILPTCPSDNEEGWNVVIAGRQGILGVRIFGHWPLDRIVDPNDPLFEVKEKHRSGPSCPSRRTSETQNVESTGKPAALPVSTVSACQSVR